MNRSRITTLLIARSAALALLLSVFALVGAQQPASRGASTAQAATAHAAVLTIDGPIGPATADHVVRGLERAAADGARVAVLRMDTPGGLDTSMRAIIRAILASPVPVLSYVGPSGARAASAGTYILYASPVAAMAPGTNLGAATPVAVGGLPTPGGERPAAPGGAKPAASAPADGGASGRAPSSASEAKSVNDAVGYIRSLAELHGRNADWAETAVRQATSLSATEALARRVVDLVARDVDDLLQQAHGRTVQHRGAAAVLDTRGLVAREVAADWRSRLLGAISSPNLAVILMMVGVYGLFFEFMNPGSLYPGTIGAISLLVGLYALSALPIDYAGAALLLLGIALMLAEAFSPSFGVLGIGGAIAFVLGGTLLVDTAVPGFGVSLPLLVGVAGLSLLLTVATVRLAVTTRRLRSPSGADGLIGQAARVLDWNGAEGHVHADGERWQAASTERLQPGQVVHVQAVRGIRLLVGSGPPPLRP